MSEWIEEWMSEWLNEWIEAEREAVSNAPVDMQYANLLSYSLSDI